jgi:hypothetical protein
MISSKGNSGRFLLGVVSAYFTYSDYRLEPLR